MKERPILFSGPMVRAILEGRKSQTRRVVKLPLKCPCTGCELGASELSQQDKDLLCPYGQPGDRLWVKEAHAFYGLNFWDLGVWHPIDRDVCCHFREGCPSELESRIEKWRPSIFMPRWASRITLEITGVRVERLLDISEDDAKAEGSNECWYPYRDSEPTALPYAYGFREIWKAVNGLESWDSNPWVWVVEFRRMTK